ncbi:hypothetical protein Dimus_037095, partial [Dionaea muscipula]
PSIVADDGLIHAGQDRQPHHIAGLILHQIRGTEHHRVGHISMVHHRRAEQTTDAGPIHRPNLPGWSSSSPGRLPLLRTAAFSVVGFHECCASSSLLPSCCVQLHLEVD